MGPPFPSKDALLPQSPQKSLPHGVGDTIPARPNNVIPEPTLMKDDEDQPEWLDWIINFFNVEDITPRRLAKFCKNIEGELEFTENGI